MRLLERSSEARFNTTRNSARLPGQLAAASASAALAVNLSSGEIPSNMTCANSAISACRSRSGVMTTREAHRESSAAMVGGRSTAAPLVSTIFGPSALASIRSATSGNTESGRSCTCSITTTPERLRAARTRSVTHCSRPSNAIRVASSQLASTLPTTSDAAEVRPDPASPEIATAAEVARARIRSRRSRSPGDGARSCVLRIGARSRWSGSTRKSAPPSAPEIRSA